MYNSYRIASMFRKIKVLSFRSKKKQEQKFNPQKIIIRCGHSKRHVTVTW